MQPTTESRAAAAAADPPDRRTGTRIARASCLPVSAALAAALAMFAGALYAPGLDDPAPAAGLSLAEVVTRPPATAIADDCPREAEGLAAGGYLLVVLREAGATPRPRAGGHSTAPTIPII